MRRGLLALLAVLTALTAVSASMPAQAGPSSTATSTATSASDTGTSNQRVSAGSLPGLRVVAVAPRTARVGEEIAVVLRWRDSSGRVFGSLEEWGDVGVGSSAPPTCEPGAVDRRGGAGSQRLTHTWDTAGTWNVRLSVTTGGCGVRTQERTVEFPVTVS